MLPEGMSIPPERGSKPWGTGHAVLCAKDAIGDAPFAVINADDYYGVESFEEMFGFLQNIGSGVGAAMMGYQLKNTVSKNGTVTRGICQVEDGKLTHVREVRRVQLMEDGSIVNITDPDSPELLDPESPVSMNFWGFSPEVFTLLDGEFRRFVSEIPEGDLRAEYLLPVFVDQMLGQGRLSVRVLPTRAAWFGVTYKEDREQVAAKLRTLHEQGIY